MSDKKIKVSHEPSGTAPKQTALQERIARWTEKATVVATSISGLYLFRRDELGEPETVIYEPSLCMLAQGAKRIYSGKGSFVYDTRSFLLAAVDFPTVAEVISASPEEPCLGLVLNIDLGEISKFLLSANMPSPRGSGSELAIGAGTVTPELLDAAGRLVALLDQPNDIPTMSPIIQREILYRLLTSDQGARLRQIATAGSRSHQIAKAIDWLKANVARRMKVEDLAAQVNMSTSTFHHHFRALTARSPLQYQKWLRLNEARRLMLVDRLDASDAAYEVGYESPSQFCREYSRTFGDSPLRDIKSIRQRSGSSPD